MGIYVLNKRGFRGDGLYVGRPSVLGNPFPMKSESDRAQVIEAYRIWLWQRVRERGEVFTELVRIRKLAERVDVRLVCWCAPKPCHADVIKRCVEWMMRERIE